MDDPGSVRRRESVSEPISAAQGSFETTSMPSGEPGSAIDPCTGTEGPVVIVEYDPAWPARFEILREELAAALGAVAERIEHVGSTAVPDLAAKPIVDIDVVIGPLSSLPDVVERLRGLGYEHLGELGVPGRDAFRTPPVADLPAGSPLRTPHHLFVLCRDSPELARHLAFRDARRDDPASAQEYATLKRRLAADLGSDRQAYTEAKSDFIEMVLQGRSGS